jgi:2-methylaconitate cis-trans-isomerase PrpF
MVARSNLSVSFEGLYPLSDAKSVPCVVIRGGTSRGLFFHECDLPGDRKLRDEVIMGAVGAPDPRQVDGIGGADLLLSKVAVVARADDDDADLECEFANIAPGKLRPAYGTNCGNLVAGVALFGIEEGLLGMRESTSSIRIRNRNSGKITEACVRGLAAELRMDDRHTGMPATGACIDLDFLEPGGSVLGCLLPTGRKRETISLDDGTAVDVSIVDAGALYVFLRAADLGLSGAETFHELTHDHMMLQRLEQIRCEAATRIGLVSDPSAATERTPDVPKLAFVGPAREYARNDGLGTVSADQVDLVSRIISSQHYHQAYAVTAAIATAAAASLEGSTVNEALGRVTVESEASFRIGHPSGVLDCRIKSRQIDGKTEIVSGGVMRTARRIMQGSVLVPNRCYFTVPRPRLGS